MGPLRRVALAVGVLVLAAAGSASAGPKDAADGALQVAFIAPAEGPGSAAADELALGIEAAFAAAGEPKISLVRGPLPPAGKTGELTAAWKKSGPAVAFAWVPDGRVREIEDAAEKAKIALVVLSPEPTRAVRDPNRAVFWAGGVRTPDEALQAMDFLLLPLNARKPAVLHDGSARGADAAARALRLHHVSQDPIDAGKDPAQALDPAKGADGIVYFGGAAGAEALLQAASASKVPILLGQGLATGDVPTFVGSESKTWWALEAEAFEDYGQVAKEDEKALADAAAPTGRSLRAATVRGWRAGRWTAEALRAAKTTDAKKLAAAFRTLQRPGARGLPVFDDLGWASLFRLGPWRPSPDRDRPPCHRPRPTLMPMQAIPQVGTFHPSQFAWQEGTLHVQCSWGEGVVRTIEKDLKALGLATGGYESELESRILDDLMGRFLSRMNRLYRRNLDGSAIPGVSYKISFTTSPPPKDAKGVKFKAFLAGDNPDTGGMASGVTANIFTTFIQRTIYLPRALAPPIAATDRPYLAGSYRWGTSVAENLRCDAVRALVDGYSQGLSLTGAHEVGHLCGLGHDTETPRSIMNVVDAAQLDFDWAEWIPSNQKTLDSFLGREPAQEK
jgi:hypothetical protein